MVFHYRAMDGDKAVCMDTINIRNTTDTLTDQDCLVYSFGISDDWSFEDGMAALGCRVVAHDPSVTYPPSRGSRITFTKVGLANSSREEGGWRVDSLANLLASHGHAGRRVHYLKVDVEGAEVECLQDWLESRVLEQIDQMGIELHLTKVHQQVSL